MRLHGLALCLLLAGCATQADTQASAYHLIPGQVPLDWRGPDGNTVVLDAPGGLIVVDTGRHPQHSATILDFAKQRARPIAAIVNTHWHLDHTTGNFDIRSAHPQAEVYATTAIDGALTGFLGRGREKSDKALADPKLPEGQKAQILRGRSVIDNPERLRPTRPVGTSGKLKIAGRSVEVYVAPYAVTEGDIWIYDPATKTAIVGDLVVDIVPFMDTACPEGWSKALEEVAAKPFISLVPGHGPAMNKARFLEWKAAFDRFVSCGRSDAKVAMCADGWSRDAASFIPETHRGYAKEAAAYYIETRFRSAPEERDRFCKPS